MNIRNIAACVFALTSLCVPRLEAQDASLQSYDLELIIFRVNRPTGSPENWSVAETATNPNLRSEEEPAPGGTLVPPPPPMPAPTTPAVAGPDTSFPALNQGQFRMNAVADNIRKSKNYQFLAHVGWTQPGFPLGSAPLVSLQNFLPGFLPDGVALSGSVSLSRGTRLLHLMLDVTYQGPDGQKYVLRETRRMRSTERHYIDHPYFGVMALITPKS